jgi:hypothetical protein
MYHDPSGPDGYTANARIAFRASFAQQVDPDGVLDHEERDARAHAALRAHMTRLALRSADAAKRRTAIAELRSMVGDLENADGADQAQATV